MVESYVLCLLLHSALLASATVHLQQTSPLLVCPEDNVSFVCTVTVSANETLLLAWFNPNNEQDAKVYIVNDTSKIDNVVGAFTTKLVEASGDTIISTATINELNVVEIMYAGISCLDGTGEDDTVYVADTAAGVPSIPVDVTLSAVSVTSVLLSWKLPPTSNTSCPPATYAITVTATSSSQQPVVINTTGATTSMTVPGLTRGLEYSFTVAGVDAGGRMGEKSLSSDAITIDKPEAVTNLSTSSVNCSNAIIVIMWMPPASSSRPPVAGYKITHNTTGSVLVNKTSYTLFLFVDVAPGVYLFSVQAVNTLGDGKAESVTVFVDSPSAPPFSLTNVYIMIGAFCIIIAITVVFLVILFVLFKHKTEKPSSSQVKPFTD